MAERPRRAGDWLCHHHGVVSPRTDTLVPSCPTCGAMALRAVQERGRDYLVYVEPAPARCAAGHPLGPGQVHLGVSPCGCPPVARVDGRGHRTWRCGTCGDVQQWPPCVQVGATPIT